jgi:hypothetical protein
MIRSVFAGAALTGTLALGAVGVAGATTTTSAPTHVVNCTKAQARAAKIEAREAKAASWVSTAQGREATATTAHHPKVAARIGRRISRVQKLEAQGTKVLARIAAKCGPTGSSAS